MTDLVCFSHLRWNFVYQRPQHLLSRAAAGRRVFFIEEPVAAEGRPGVDITQPERNLWVVTPRLSADLDGPAHTEALRAAVDGVLASFAVDEFVAWYYTPMALAFTDHLEPAVTVYDCMDELSAFKGAPPAMRESERRLLSRADLVFAGGRSLYESKRTQHPQAHLFPSSVDASHFSKALVFTGDPEDQAGIPHPRVGYCGVVDERLDYELLAAVAGLRPGVQFIVVGPVVKIDEAALPKRDNIHYLGGKEYAALPRYLAGWDVAMMPFARNEATRYISPTKTPEYLAAGRPVVSTSIRDVVADYGASGLVRIADEPAAFAQAIDEALAEDPRARRARVEELLASKSWDCTWDAMDALIDNTLAARKTTSAAAQLLLGPPGQAALR